MSSILTIDKEISDVYRGFWTPVIAEEYVFLSEPAESLTKTPTQPRAFSPNLGHFTKISATVSLRYAKQQELVDLLARIDNLSEYIRHVENVIPTPDLDAVTDSRETFNLNLKGENALALQYYLKVLIPFDRCCLSVHQNNLSRLLPIEAYHGNKLQMINQWSDFAKFARVRSRGIFMDTHALYKPILEKSNTKKAQNQV